MIRKLTLAIVTCPTSSILIQNHSAFHEYFANKRQIKASLSLEIVKKTRRDRMQRPRKVCRPKKVCDRMLPRSTLLRNLARFPRILTSVSILIVHVLLYEEPIKLEIEINYPRVSPGDQPLTKSRRWTVIPGTPEQWNT